MIVSEVQGAHLDAARLRAVLELRGGFTFNGATSKPITEGIAVCADPGTTLSFDIALWSDADVGAWLEGNFNSNARGRHIGGWLDSTGRVWLESVVVYPPDRLAGAVNRALVLGQRAIFDIGRSAVLDVPLR